MHPEEILFEINHRRNKIYKLMEMSQSKELTNIQIHFFADKKYHTIYQMDIPFSLNNEIRILLLESIQQLEQEIESLKLQF